jgi:hypothetical protein
MRVGVAYNVFDGEELLLPSVRRMRRFADKVVVVYSGTSNFGEHNPGLAPVLERIERERLADVMVQHFPKKGAAPHRNELDKRNLGLEQCLDCDVFMTVDCDEFYVPEELDFALRVFVGTGRDSSACKMQTYYKRPDTVIVPAEEYYVPLFYRVDERRFRLSERWPLEADPTRKMPAGQLLEFDRNMIQMHHMSYVRADIRRKLRNSSANANFSARVEEIARWHDEWDGGQALLAGRERRIYDTQTVEILFPDLINIA